MVEVILNSQKNLNQLRKGLINIQNIDDNECFNWCLVRYLRSVNKNPARIRNTDKDFARKLDFKNKIFCQN